MRVVCVVLCMRVCGRVCVELGVRMSVQFACDHINVCVVVRVVLSARACGYCNDPKLTSTW